MKKTKVKKIKVNELAYGTWLDPYIGWEFELVNATKKHVYFLMDNGGTEKDIEKYDIRVFDFQN